MQHTRSSSGVFAGTPLSPGPRHRSELIAGAQALVGLPPLRGPCAVGQPRCTPRLVRRSSAGCTRRARGATTRRSGGVSAPFLDLLLRHDTRPVGVSPLSFRPRPPPCCWGRGQWVFPRHHCASLGATSARIPGSYPEKKSPVSPLPSHFQRRPLPRRRPPYSSAASLWRPLYVLQGSYELLGQRLLREALEEIRQPACRGRNEYVSKCEGLVADVDCDCDFCAAREILRMCLAERSPSKHALPPAETGVGSDFV